VAVVVEQETLMIQVLMIDLEVEVVEEQVLS
jgi:hypothetical protein